MYVLFPETNAAETTAQDSIFVVHNSNSPYQLSGGHHREHRQHKTTGTLRSTWAVARRFHIRLAACLFSYQGTSTGKWQRGNFMATMRNIVTF